MPEIREVETVYDRQGNVVETVMGEISDEQLHQEALAQEFNDGHIAALAAVNNWSQVTTKQKDTLLKQLVRYALWKEGYL